MVTTEIFLHTKPPQDAPPSKPPSLNWRSVKALMGQQNTTAPANPGSLTATDAPPDAQVTEEAEAGLAALNELGGESISPPGALFFDTEGDGVDLSIPFFRDLLNDTPVDGADEIRSLSSWAETSDKVPGSMSKVASVLTFGGDVGELVF
jgi:hypothetical protein